jgi:hypothetical protein
MGESIKKYQGAGAGEILSLNIEDLDVVELERRLEMAVAFGASGFCGVKKCESCGALTSCGTYCN